MLGFERVFVCTHRRPDFLETAPNPAMHTRVFNSGHSVRQSNTWLAPGVGVSVAALGT